MTDIRRRHRAAATRAATVGASATAFLTMLAVFPQAGGASSASGGAGADPALAPAPAGNESAAGTAGPADAGTTPKKVVRVVRRHIVVSAPSASGTVSSGAPVPRSAPSPVAQAAPAPRVQQPVAQPAPRPAPAPQPARTHGSR